MSDYSAVDKIKLKHAFSQSSLSYDRVAHLQREVGGELITMMADLALQGLVIDLGCGTGFLSAEFLATRSKESVNRAGYCPAYVETSSAKITGSFFRAVFMCGY